MPSLRYSKKFLIIGLFIVFTSWFTGCDKIPFIQNSGEEDVGKQGIIQADWQDNQENEVDLSEPDKGGAGSNQMVQTPSPVKVEPSTTLPKKPAQVSNQHAGFAVQIGAFLQPDNATRLISKLKKKGYTPNLVIVETPAKKWNLVRIGSYKTKKGAVKAARKFTTAESMETAVVKDRTIIKMQAKSDQSIKMEKVSIEKSMPVTVAKFEPEQFTFQVGGLRTKGNANKHKAALKKQGYAPYIKKIINRQSNETWYSIRIGTYNSIDLAAEAASEFTAKESIPAQAVSVNQ